MLFVDLIHRRATERGLVLEKSGRNYMQNARADDPELARHRAWIANHDRLKPDGAPHDYRRLLRILRLLDEANHAVQGSPPTSTFAEAGRRRIAGEFRPPGEATGGGAGLPSGGAAKVLSFCNRKPNVARPDHRLSPSRGC